MLRAIFILLIAKGLLPGQQDQREIALGALMADEIRRHTSALECPVALDLVRQLGNRLVTQVLDGPRAIEFSLIRDDSGEPTHHPLVAPGAYIFVPAPLILAAENEDELAGMIAYAIADRPLHSTGRLTGYGAIPLVYFGTWLGGARLLPESLREQQKAAEMESDREAVQALTAAGYNANALFQYLSRFIPSGERLDALRPRENEPLPRASAAFLAIQSEVRRLVPNIVDLRMNLGLKDEQFALEQPPGSLRVPIRRHNKDRASQLLA